MPILYESRKLCTISKNDEEQKARAVRLLDDHQGEYSSLTASCLARESAGLPGHEHYTEFL